MGLLEFSVWWSEDVSPRGHVSKDLKEVRIQTMKEEGFRKRSGRVNTRRIQDPKKRPGGWCQESKTQNSSEGR